MVASNFVSKGIFILYINDRVKIALSFHHLSGRTNLIGSLGILNNISSWGVYPNIGKTEFDNDYFDLISDSNFKEGIKSILLKNPDVIGICCGSTPRHLKSLKKLINIRQQK